MTRRSARSGRLRRAVRPLAGLLLLVLTASCGGLPTSGPVVVRDAGDEGEAETVVDFTPGGPREDAPPPEIVRGFLVAMQATPLNTSVARRFLTAESAQAWVPERGTVVYEEETRAEVGRRVRLELDDTVGLDSSGRWLGRQGDRGFDLAMVRQGGQWRISDPPDRLLVPLTHFETRYARHFLYFFERGGEVLVPEPVHVPTGPQATTMLAAGLLEGPRAPLAGVERTYVPAGTRLDDISVPVRADGTAEIRLSPEFLDGGREQTRRALGQLIWTLGQVPEVQAVHVEAGGSPVRLPGLVDPAPLAAASEFDPAVPWASASLFGIRDGLVVGDVADRERRASGALGSLDLGQRTVGVDLLGERVAATTADGRLRVSARSRRPGTEPGADAARTVADGLVAPLPPMWDLHGGLWLVDRTADGARVLLVREGRSRPVPVPGVTGQDVASAAMSRDGTRLAVEVEVRGGSDRLLVARVARGGNGRVEEVRAADRVSLRGLGVREIRDVGWPSPGGVALLTAPGPETSQLVVVDVDGSTSPTDATSAADIFAGRAEELVSSPSPGTAVYLHTTGGRVAQLTSNGRWVGAGVAPGLRSPTFVG